MLKIAICDDSEVDMGQLETALGALSGYQIEYDVYFSAVDLLEYVSQHREKEINILHKEPNKAITEKSR